MLSFYPQGSGQNWKINDSDQRFILPKPVKLSCNVRKRLGYTKEGSGADLVAICSLPRLPKPSKFMKSLDSGSIFTCGMGITEDSDGKIHVSKVLNLKNEQYGHVAFQNMKHFDQTPSEQKVMMQNRFTFFLSKKK